MKKKIFKHIYVSLLRILPIKKDKIVFCNFSGRGYGDNPKYIAEEIHKRNLNIDISSIHKVCKNVVITALL